MKGRHLALALLPMLVAATLAAVRSADRRWEASRILRAVEGVTAQVQAAGLPLPLRRQLLEQNLRVLRRARELAPAEVAVAVLRGSQLALLDRPRSALDAFEEARELEARAEVYLNLGYNRWALGELEEAREAFTVAVLLDRTTVREVRKYFPPGERPWLERMAPPPPSRPPRPRPEPAGAELFEDGFESGDASRWEVPAGGENDPREGHRNEESDE